MVKAWEWTSPARSGPSLPKLRFKSSATVRRGASGGGVVRDRVAGSGGRQWSGEREPRHGQREPARSDSSRGNVRAAEAAGFPLCPVPPPGGEPANRQFERTPTARSPAVGEGFLPAAARGATRRGLRGGRAAATGGLRPPRLARRDWKLMVNSLPARRRERRRERPLPSPDPATGRSSPGQPRVGPPSSSLSTERTLFLSERERGGSGQPEPRPSPTRPGCSTRPLCFVSAPWAGGGSVARAKGATTKKEERARQRGVYSGTDAMNVGRARPLLRCLVLLFFDAASFSAARSLFRGRTAAGVRKRAFFCLCRGSFADGRNSGSN